MLGLADTLKSIKGKRIMVVGDLMLDVFVYGDVNRISPESPVPVLSVQKEDRMLGGGGNVLMNLSALGAVPVMVCVTGADAAADEVAAIVKTHGAEADFILKDSSRPTTFKTRYLARHQHLLRTDVEKTHPVSGDIERALLDGVRARIKTVKAVVLSDYGKGVLTRTLVQAVIAAAKESGIPVLVDPKGCDYSVYQGADYVTPNRKELAEATGLSDLVSDAAIESAAQTLITQSGIGCVVATRSEDGMSVIGPKTATHLRTQAREVFDVSGAGDTVIATIAAALATGADIQAAATLSNLAAGISVSRVGTTPVRADELLAALDGSSHSGRQARLVDAAGAREQVRTWQAQGLKVGFTNGCFDIVHKGHVNYLEQARSRCERLVVALNHDASVRLLKGPARPVNDELARAAVVGSLSSVDLVVLFGAQKLGEDNTPCALIDLVRPDIFFKGGDYRIDQLPEAAIVQSYGGTVEIMGLEDGFSTTGIIAKTSQKTA